MTESEPLLEVEPVEPTWLKLKRKHSITATYLEHQDKVGAIYGTHYALGDDERYAVIRLVQMLKLEGWETVSLER